AFDADDKETTRHCVHALKGLARNFEAADLEGKAVQIETAGACRETITELLALADAWVTAAEAGTI
ncbi:MAG TPA: Hpt domain-containing protein, partial [Aestuariivirga sp.]|nr:Hpt domain-containing protein [Aestuariivirga sp.]